MPIKTISYIKTRFETGDKPTQQDFYDLLESLKVGNPSSVVITAPTDVIPATDNNILLVGTSAGSGNIVLTSNPQINGATDGSCIVLVGNSDTDYVTVINGNGLLLRSNYDLMNGRVLVLQYLASLNLWIEIGRSHISHSILLDLDADDHPQYLNNTRGDTRYYPRTEADTTFLKKAGDTVAGDLVITGNLTVQGTTTTLDTQQLQVNDNIILLNSNVTGDPIADAGVEIQRGTQPNVQLKWNETSDEWQLTPDGTNFYTIWHAGNDGTGSGLDADTLDGQHASAFASAGNLTINASGDATGSVTISNAGGSSGTLTLTVVDDSHNHGNTTITDVDWSKLTSVPSPTITLTGGVSGSGTMTNLGDVSINVTVDPTAHSHDDRYYTEAESDARFVLKSGDTISGNLVITGDLTVQGTTTTINTQDLVVSDNIILLNSGQVGIPTLNAGIEIERGDSPNVQLRWNESTDSWEVTSDGTNFFKLWHAGNDGAGSGLDADLLDGKQAADFANAVHTHVRTDVTDFDAGVKSIINTAITTGTQNGIAVTYDEVNNAMHFNVNDPTITLTGDVSGSGVLSNLSDLTITTTVNTIDGGVVV